MGGEWYGGHRPKIIDPVQFRLMSREVVPCYEQVNGIR